VDTVKARAAAIRARSTASAKEMLQRFSDHALFPALIDEIESRYPKPDQIGDVAVIDALNALLQKKDQATPPSEPGLKP
jgi:hypothetical protein